MMRLKLFLESSARNALLFSLSAGFLCCGCNPEIKPTYQEQDIPKVIKKICKDEYGLEVSTKRTASTIWVYAPMDKMLHKDYGKQEGKIFDEELLDKLRNIIITIGRVLVNSDNTPDFYVLTASDINLGLDYSLIGYVLDTKKSYAEFIPWPEANRRYVIKLELSPGALGDKTGRHVKAHDIKLTDFLADQMAQRIINLFQEGEFKKDYLLEKFVGRYENNNFYFDYIIKKNPEPEKESDAKDAMLDVISYCIKTYEFKDFSTVVLTDLLTQAKEDLNKAAIWGRATE